MIKNRLVSFFTIMVLTLSLVISTIGTAEAAIVPSGVAPTLAAAIAADPTQVTGASFVTRPPSGNPTAVSDTPLTGFPTNGPTYAILSTGDATIAANPNNSTNSGADNNGGKVRGTTDYDVVILKIDLNAPAGAACLSFNFRFLSEEYPEFVGTKFNDAFIAELDASTWTTSNTTISAPNNFAFDENGNPISINSAGAATVNASNAGGTTYDGATALLTASTPVTPGAHSLYLSIFDQGDHALDSAVFVDNLNFTNATCQKGLGTPPSKTAPKPEPKPADLVGQLRVTPDRQFSLSNGSDNVLTYTLTIKNIGQGAASNVYARLPIDPNLEVGYATIDPAEKDLWVESIITDVTNPYIQIRFPNIEINTKKSLMISFRAKTGAVVDTSVFTRATVYWDDDADSGKHSLSNGVRFTLTGNTNRDDSGGEIQLFGLAPGSNNSFLVGSDFFIPAEYVDFWYTDKNDQSTALGRLQVDGNGNLVIQVSLAPFQIGETYTIAGRGGRSEVTGAGLIRVVASTSEASGKAFVVESLKNFNTVLATQSWKQLYKAR